METACTPGAAQHGHTYTVIDVMVEVTVIVTVIGVAVVLAVIAMMKMLFRRSSGMVIMVTEAFVCLLVA